MRRSLSADDKGFQTRVIAFIEAHWLASAGQSDTLRLQRWQAGLVAEGWTVPHWPVEFGGCGWSATQAYLWFSSCAQYNTPQSARTGVDVVGPILMAGKHPDAQDWLADIAAFRSRWCLGIAERGHHLDVVETQICQEDQENWHLHGHKVGVDIQRCDWLCCLAARPPAGIPVWVAVRVDASGVKIQRTGTASARVDFDKVVIPHTHLLGDAVGVLAPDQLALNPARVLYRARGLQRQIDVLTEIVADFEGEEGLQQRLLALAVATRGLLALEQRCVDAVQKGVPLPVPLAALALRGREIFAQLGELQMESFGYYALPYPDGLLTHNEGPVAPGDISETMVVAMAQQAGALDEEFMLSRTTVRDQIAEQLRLSGTQDQASHPG